jgi:EPS-associated MarR family transcriptional regulator
MTSSRKKLQEDTHFRVLRILQENGEMSQRDLADAVGVSTGGINYVLRSLIDKGFVKLGVFTAAQNKQRYAYILTPRGLSEKVALTQRFLARKMEEYQALRAEIEDLRSEADEGEGAKAVLPSE